MEEDIRWIQRFDNFKSAFNKLSEAIKMINSRLISKDNDILNDLIKEGLIQKFEYTHELAWNVMKDFLNSKGISTIIGSKDATREAFLVKIIEDGHTWMDMIKSRNLTSHTYNEDTANEIYNKILNEYFPIFELFYHKMAEKVLEKENN